MDPTLFSIHIYPLKSAGGIAVGEAQVDATGLHHDRRWLLVDAQGRFLSQRSHPRMALLRTALGERTLRVSAPAMNSIELPLEPPADAARHETVAVWGTDRYAVSCGSAAREWASTFLRADCRIMRAVAPQGQSRVDVDGRVRAGFADGFPALVISTASLEDLNARLSAPLPMNRFRPNLVLAGLPAYAEDACERLAVGAVVLRARKRCPRCAITTTDQETSERGVEPLRTLVAYRSTPDGDVAFGMNMGFEVGGTLRVGDPVRLLAGTLA